MELYRTLRLLKPLSDLDCIEVLAYVAFARGLDEQIVYNQLFYEDLTEAKKRVGLFVEANNLMEKWRSNPELMSAFLSRYNLKKVG